MTTTETPVPARWRDLVTLPLDAVLAAGPEGHDGSTLRIGRAVEMALELTNRSPQLLRLEPSGGLRLGFRPHTLLDQHAVTVDGASAAEGWTLSAEPVEDNGLRQVLALRCDRAVVLDPGDTYVIHLDGLAADGFGGSRATHASFEYTGVVVADADRTALADRIVLPLSILHDVVAAPGDARSGSNAATEAISARLDITDAVLSDGVTRSMLRVILHNRTGADIDLRTDGEARPRISLHTEAAGSLPSTLLGSGRMGISTETDHLPDGWNVVAPDDLALEPAVPGAWAAGADLGFWIAIVSDAPPGLVPLHVRYETLPGVDPGTLTLLVRVGFLQNTIWTTDLVKTVRLWGTESALELHTGELNVSGALAGRLSASHQETDLGRLTLAAPVGLTITSPEVRLPRGKLVIEGNRRQPAVVQIGKWTVSENKDGGLEFTRGSNLVATLAGDSGGTLLLGNGTDGKVKPASRWQLRASGEELFVQFVKDGPGADMGTRTPMTVRPHAVETRA